MSEKKLGALNGFDFANQPSQSWDRLASEYAPLEVDAIWEARQRAACTADQYRDALKTRFYLKALYGIFAKNYNFGVLLHRFVEFEMPPPHFDDWQRLDAGERAELFTKFRFAPVGDNPQTDNRFVLMADEKITLMFGHLDSVFVARHGLQLPEKWLVSRQAKAASIARFANYRLAHDERTLAETEQQLKATVGAMSQADADHANEIVCQLRAVVEQGRKLVKNVAAANRTADAKSAAEPKAESAAVDVASGLTRAELEALNDIRADIEAAVNSAAREK